MPLMSMASLFELPYVLHDYLISLASSTSLPLFLTFAALPAAYLAALALRAIASFSVAFTGGRPPVLRSRL